MSNNEDVAKEYLLGPGDRVRLQKWWYNCMNQVEALYTSCLRGTIIDVDESARECAYYEVEWDNVVNFEDLWKKLDRRACAPQGTFYLQQVGRIHQRRQTFADRIAV